MSTVAWHNTHLTAIVMPDASSTVKWSGNVEAYLFEGLLEGDDRMTMIWRAHLAIPSNLGVNIEAGDFAVFVRDKDGATNTREVRDLVDRSLFGIVRLHFADR